MSTSPLELGEELARVRLTAGLMARLLGRTEWLSVRERGLAVESKSQPTFIPWSQVQSLRQGRAQDAFVVVHSNGQRVVVPALAAGAEADTLIEAIVAQANLTWIEAGNARVPPMAVPSASAAAYEQAFRTWSRVD